MTELAEYILRLVSKLLGVSAGGSVASGHDIIPMVLPGARYDGREEVRINRDFQRLDALQLTANPGLAWFADVRCEEEQSRARNISSGLHFSPRRRQEREGNSR